MDEKKVKEAICKLNVGINAKREKIKHNKYFQKYNIPIEFLKISKITLTKDATLEFIFELKEFCIEENKHFETEDNISIKRR